MNAGDVISWNALISGYTKHGRSYEALYCFDRIRGEGLVPNSVTFLCLLKACSNVEGGILKGKQIHNEVVIRGLLKRDHVLGTALVTLYAKCSEFEKAKQVHKELCIRDVVSWSALIGGYAHHGHVHEAWSCFQSMQEEGHSPNSITFLSILQACGSTCAVGKGREAHTEIVIRGMLDRTALLDTALVNMYAECGKLAEAQRVHDELPTQSTVSWSALITGYIHHGKGHEALKCFEEMQGKGLSPDVVSFVCVLKACGSIRAVAMGERIHDQLVALGLLEKSVILGTALVDMYVKCGLLGKALQVHDDLHVRDVISWSLLIAGYAQHEQGYEALNCFEQMQSEGLSPNAVTFLSVLKACGSTGSINKGKLIHDEIVHRRLLGSHGKLGTALVDMYAKCGMLAKAHAVHEMLHIRDIVSYGALIGGFADYGKGREALNYYAQMRTDGLSPDVAILISVLKACGSIGALVEGECIHKEIVSLDLLERNVELGSALVDMYAKCGRLQQAQDVHDILGVRNLDCWNALIAGYIQQRQGHEALTCFEQMQGEGISPDMTTFLYIFKACGTMGTITEGEFIYSKITGNQESPEKNIMLGSALVNMYARYGLFTKAWQVLDELPIRNLISWSALIEGYSQQGQVREVLNCIRQMQEEGLCPDASIFLLALNACSHSGLLEEAQTCFGCMVGEYNIKPTLAHYTCMVVIFGCMGLFDKALWMIQMMPSSDYLAIWLVLLGACRKWGNVKLGMGAFDQAVQVDSGDAGAAATYVLMADLFAASGMEMDAKRMRVMAMRLNVILANGN